MIVNENLRLMLEILNKQMLQLIKTEEPVFLVKKEKYVRNHEEDVVDGKVEQIEEVMNENDSPEVDKNMVLDKRVTRLQSKDKEKKRREEERDMIGAFWLNEHNNECFAFENTVFSVEVPVKYHKLPEVLEAKQNEVRNLTDYNTFEEVEDVGQKKIGSRWVISKKESHDGQKKDFKARIVAKGFQEDCKPQADSPTAMKESNKIFLAISANEGFEIQSVDIKAAFLQSKVLDREVYVEPPKDIKHENKIWRLIKPLYGLGDASRKFWLRVKDIFKQKGLKTVVGDKAFYYKHDGGKLLGMVITHVDDFNIAGSEEFIDDLVQSIKRELTVSKIEKGSFRFTGVDIERMDDGIVVSMEEYAESIESLDNIRKTTATDRLTEAELKIYRKYTGKFSWLAMNVRPDLAITAVKMAIRGRDATIKDLKRINYVIEKIRRKPN